LTKELKAKLEAALATLDAGKDVPTAKLKRLLGVEGYERFLDDWRRQQELREEMCNKPDEIVEYERLLRLASFTYNKADAFSGAGNHKTAEPLFNNAATQFERVLEHLSENVAGRGELVIWFDRNVSFHATNRPSLSPANFPQVITSRSRLNVSDRKLPGMMSKRDVKRTAIEVVLEMLDHSTSDEAQVASRLLAAQRLKRSVVD
jgi:hypothetical protein